MGTFAVQLAKLKGAEVTGVDKAHKLEVVLSVGADHVIDYTKEDFTQNGQRYDLILDAQGVRSMFDYKRALNPHGTYAMVGGAVPRILPALFFGLWGSITGEQKFRLVAEGPSKGLADLKKLIEAGKIIPVVDRVYKLSEVPEAFRYFAEGRHKGKVVIAMVSEMTGLGRLPPDAAHQFCAIESSFSEKRGNGGSRPLCIVSNYV